MLNIFSFFPLLFFLTYSFDSVATFSKGLTFTQEYTFEEVRKAGGFNSTKLSEEMVEVITPSGTPLSEDEKTDLCQSKTLDYLRSLDLHGQNLDDAFVKNLSDNPSLKRLVNIDLSDNPKITAASLAYILNSPSLGAIRDMPQISGKYGEPCSTIFVKASKTAITPEDIEKDKLYNFDFEIHYLHPRTQKETRPSSEEAIKCLDCEL